MNTNSLLALILPVFSFSGCSAFIQTVLKLQVWAILYFSYSPLHRVQTLLSPIILLVSIFPSTHLSLRLTDTTAVSPRTAGTPQLRSICTLIMPTSIHMQAHTEAGSLLCSTHWTMSSHLMSSTKFWIKLNSVSCLWVPACSVSRVASPTSSFQFLCCLLLFEPQDSFLSTSPKPGSYPQGLCKFPSLFLRSDSPTPAHVQTHTSYPTIPLMSNVHPLMSQPKCHFPDIKLGLSVLTT